AARITGGNGVDGFHLFGRHRRKVAAPFIGLEEDLVGEHVQFFLHFALNVFALQASQYAAERAFADMMADCLAGARHNFDEQAHVCRQGAIGALVLDQELSEGLAFHAEISSAFETISVTLRDSEGCSLTRSSSVRMADRSEGA